MINSIVFLPLVALVLNDVQTERVDNILNVTLTTSEPIPIDRVKGMTGPQRMYVLLNDTKTSEKAFPSDFGPIVALTRSRYTKLEIPSGPGGRCLEPVMVESTATGVRLRARCNDSVVALSPEHTLGMAKVARTSIHAEAMVPPRSKAEETQLRQALMPPRVDGVGEVTKGNEPKVENPLKGDGRTLKEAERMMVQSASSPKILQRSSDEDKVTVPAAMPANSVPATNHEVLAVGTSKAENGYSLIFAVTLLAGLGLAAFLLARRRASHGRMIHILETASIGAKRSLVVANVSGRTMVLAVSEAGVTLLDSTCTPVTATAQAESSESDANFVTDELPVGRLTALCEKLSSAFKSKKNMSDEERLASDGEPIEPEERTEGGMLGRLFSRRQSEQVEPEPTFQDVLDDSFEDQQLRQKLAAGMGGRVA